MGVEGYKPPVTERQRAAERKATAAEIKAEDKAKLRRLQQIAAEWRSSRPLDRVFELYDSNALSFRFRRAMVGSSNVKPAPTKIIGEGWLLSPNVTSDGALALMRDGKLFTGRDAPERKAITVYSDSRITGGQKLAGAVESAERMRTRP